MTTKRSKRLSPLRRKMAFDAIDLCVDKFIPRLKDKVFIQLNGEYDLLEKSGIYGDCDWEEEGLTLPRSFTIRVDNNLPLQTFISTIMHEMVHVKQWCKGEMKWLSRSEKTRWKGTIISDRREYYNQPWEIEAHGHEEGMMELFREKFPRWALVLHDCEEQPLENYNHRQMRLKF